MGDIWGHLRHGLFLLLYTSRIKNNNNKTNKQKQGLITIVTKLTGCLRTQNTLRFIPLYCHFLTLRPWSLCFIVTQFSHLQNHDNSFYFTELLRRINETILKALGTQ